MEGMQQAHTKTPWKIVLSDNATPHIMRDEARDIDDLENLVCNMPGEILNSFNSYENAKFIVRACNAHDDLVKALEDLEFAAARYMTSNKEAAIVASARAALAKAKGGAA